MVKEDINLLPPPVSQSRVHWLVTKQRDRTVYTVLIGIFFVATAYATNWYALYQTELAIREELANLEAETSAAEVEARQINLFVRALASRLVNADSWTEHSLHILSQLPSDAAITHINTVAAIVDRQPANAIVIEGVSNTRESLIQFEEGLRTLPWIAHLEAPLRNLSGSNSPFAFLFIAFRTE